MSTTATPEGSRLRRFERFDWGAAGRPGRQEVLLVLGVAALGFLVRCVYLLATRGDPLGGDEGVYDAMGRLAREGLWLWGTTPFGDPHPTFWKMPGYPLWISALYTVLGPTPTGVGLVQALGGVVTIVLTWILARRLDLPRWAAVAAALVVALHPFAWQYTVLLYPEAIVGVPVLLVLLLAINRPPTPGRAAAVGALAGLALLVRPNMLALVVAAAAGWIAVAGWRRGLMAGAMAAVVAALFLVPWTIRNHELSGGSFIPLSVQDGAIAGTFNATSASDPVHPYKWRIGTERDRDLLRPGPDGRRPTEVELLQELRRRGLAYIAEHPESVPLAFFWNGITRFWDLRRPSHVGDDVTFQGGVRSVTLMGLALHWILLPLALLGSWQVRHRRQLVVTVLVLGVLSSVATTVVAGTRYRSPLEPVIAVLACAGVAGIAARRRARGAAPDGHRAA